MKTLAILTFLNLFVFVVHAEVRTLTLDTSATNSTETITVSALQTIELKGMRAFQSCYQGYTSEPPSPWIEWNINGILFKTSTAETNATSLFVSGPATVRLIAGPSCSQAKAFVTFDIQPSAFPPDKALTLGAFSGNVKVTMEQSSDLVNWTAAQNGLIYTNAPDARFFRIKMEKNAQ